MTSYLSRAVFGSMLDGHRSAACLASEPGQPSTLEPVARDQETNIHSAVPVQAGGKKAAELVGSIDDKALLNAAANTATG